MPAPAVICQLVQHFSDHGEAYHSGKYNEAQLRLEFLDPFFEALGWDMFNKQGYAEAYKDVIHEDAIRIGGVVKAPDYAFRVGGTRKFFVEAKTPAVDVKGEISPAYQLRRYAWSAKLPLSILTDFEEFAVYDCRTKPDIGDKASTGRVMYLRYPDYLEKWEEIAAIFSHEAVLKGSFDKYAETALGKHGTAEVDQAFLAEISRWRELLARNIALRNTGLSQRELNYAVQMTIDRIIFLRICEDRGIEFYGQLQSLLNGREVYSRLVNIFRKADQRYNSGLFHFRKEKDQVESPDELTPGLVVNDRSLKDILGNLYYPDSPYEFSVLPADILGQVYEQFLGKVIRLTAGHHAVIEEKPEVKKAGGVYYTPTYIVEYIVRHTVGDMLEDRKPGEKGVGKSEPLRILDPACGSGSFLLGAFQYLLNWYRDGYFADGVDKWTKGKSPTLYQAAHGEWKLTTGERKRILLDHIYGVDIDPQAVEVTKLSLLLKVLEGESEQILAHQLSLWQERALPDLGKNIKCGNSLIGPDFYQGKQMGFMDEEERYRINAFDWEREFPQVFGASDGGFDVVIGNPPYIRIQALKEWTPKEVEFYKKRYTAASKGNYDIYVVFVEKGLSVLNKRGRLGFILPHKFFNAQYGKPIRELLAKGKHLSKVVHFGDQQVFSGATTYTCLMFLDKTGSETLEFEKVNNLEIWRGIRLIGSPETLKVSQTGIISAGSITAREWNFIVGQEAALFEKLRQMPVKLGDVTDRIYQGLITGADAVFILRKVGSGSYYSQATGKEHCIEDDLMHDLCKGSVNIHRYSITELEKSILFPYRVEAGRANLLSKEELVLKYHFAWEYLQENRKILETRERGKWRHSRWYAFGRTQNLGEMEQIKILTPSIAKRASYTLDKNGNLFFIGSGGGGGGGYGITIKYTKLSYEYILGLLNSYLLDSYLKTYSSPFSGGYFAYNRQYIEQLPIHLINFSDPVEIAKRNRIVVLVESMLTFNHQIASAKTPSERNFLQRQIEATDREIDALVYELYGLTDEEIRIVEGRE